MQVKNVLPQAILIFLLQTLQLGYHLTTTYAAAFPSADPPAAMMSYYMFTGNQLLGDTTYESTFPKLWNNNIEIKEGLGLLDSAIVDQHFVARSRYNRLLTAIAKYPTLPCIGIDEGTAIIVHGNNIRVAGTSQVIVFSKPQNLRVTKNGYIKFDDVKMSIYTEGDTFQLK